MEGEAIGWPDGWKDSFLDGWQRHTQGKSLYTIACVRKKERWTD